MTLAFLKIGSCITALVGVFGVIGILAFIADWALNKAVRTAEAYYVVVEYIFERKRYKQWIRSLAHQHTEKPIQDDTR